MTPEQFDVLYNLRQEIAAYEMAMQRVEEWSPTNLSTMVGPCFVRIVEPADIHAQHRNSVKAWLGSVLAKKTQEFQSIKVTP
jgi:hypothetical protein